MLDKDTAAPDSSAMSFSHEGIEAQEESATLLLAKMVDLHLSFLCAFVLINSIQTQVQKATGD